MNKPSTGNTTPLNALTPEQLAALPDDAIAYDADNPVTTAADWQGAALKQNGQIVGRIARGKQHQPTKRAVTVRYDADIIEAFKSQGKGWQTRMNAALRDWLTAHQ